MWYTFKNTNNKNFTYFFIFANMLLLYFFSTLKVSETFLILIKNFFCQTCHRFWSDSFETDYTIPIDFLLGSSDSERFCSLPKIMRMATFHIKYGNVVHDRRKKHNWWIKDRTKTKERKRYKNFNWNKKILKILYNKCPFTP